MKTRITEKLGIRHPIVQGGMQWVGTADLAAAVSNAGGLGILTALIFPNPEALGREIDRLFSLTDKPVAVNLTLLPTLQPVPYMDYAEMIVDKGVTIVETAGRSPAEFMPLFRNAGMTVIHKCTSVRHALKAQEMGCAIVSVDGFECAGHPGEDDIPGLILLPLAADQLHIPILASGGFADGRGLAAALALGADGINMGTRFVATREAPVHANIKKALVDGDEHSTALVLRTLHNTARIFRNRLAEEIVALEKRGGVTIDELAPLVAGRRGEQALKEGDVHGGVWGAGPVTGLIRDIPSVQELLDRIVREAEAVIGKRLASMTG
ncbi:nitronate monooxygenase family protein [Desulfobotulus sp. H1]|uniref:Nitronate monooxygenase family protein n=1 Tax=Desulfobotulus pelophilus TaxID=2823377 RepID=A0ABT3N838_9BACT|nr:nitronate monooxygenase family protein [Desulfobotulus pelophilus]MCW7753615.1 nitronate monooxygenase family protein [Desulfobotulus pelophilus]